MSSPNPPSTEPDGTPLAGRLLAGRYRLEHPIASGGMAQVWEALDQTLARRVAVKILHPHLARDDSFVRRFRAEAVAAARLSHPSIVSVYDTCNGEGVEAIVMELVRGTTLRAELDTHGPMQLPAALAIGTQVADALGAAHAAGLVHRDVKPANILLSADGRVLVADFGIAKAAEGNDLTTAGAMIGTAKYLAPEQVEDRPLDGRADLYALGVVLYEALGGEAPFVGDTDAATALARLHRDPRPLRELRAEVPVGVAEVIHQALRRDPDERFASAAAMRAALISAGAEPARAPQAAATAAASAAAAPPRPPAPAETLVDHVGGGAEPGKRRRWPVLLGAIALVGAVAWGTTRLGSTATPHQQVRPIATATIFDPPPGDGTEHDDQAAFAIDGDPTTAWTSERYKDPASVGGKGGVGLTLALDQAANIDRVEVATAAAGWSAQIYAVDADAPTTLDGWGAPLASVAEVTAATTTVTFDEVRASHVLVWFTKLPSAGAVEVSAVTVLGR